MLFSICQHRLSEAFLHGKIKIRKIDGWRKAIMLFVQYPKCTTCKKAKAWLEAGGFPFEDRNIQTASPSEAELRAWHTKSGLPLRKLFNTSGLQYKALGLKDKLPDMTEEEQYALLASDGMLVKRPVLVGEDFAFFGFKEADWALRLEKK